MSKILIVVPAFNEELSLPEVVKAIKETSSEYDILVVDDSSTDKTAAIGQQLGITVISLQNNLGIGGAVQTGFRYAAERDYDIVVQVDGDGQHIPQEIPKIIQPLQEKRVDLCIGSRYLETTGYKGSRHRRAGTAFFSKLVSFITSQNITDTTSGFRALSKPVAQFFAQYYPVDFPDAEAIIVAHFAGFKIAEVAVKMNLRQFGKSSTDWKKSLYYPFKTLISVVAAILSRSYYKHKGLQYRS